jgi:hypothetical protein
MFERLLQLLSVLMILAGSREAFASGVVEVVYEADSDCPLVDEFLLRVRANARDIELAPSTHATAPVHISVHAASGAYVGRMDVQRERAASSRELVAPSCDEAASALAFVLALALDSKDDADSAEPSVESTGDAAKVESTRTTMPATIVDRPRAGTLGENARLAWWAGVQAGWQTAPLPDGAITFGAFAELRLLQARVLTPSIQLALLWSGPKDVPNAPETARLSWGSSRVSLCPARVPVGSYVAFVPCVGIHAGLLWASGTPTRPGATGVSSVSPWMDALGGLHVDVAPSQSFTLRLGFEMRAILTPYDVVYENPNTVVYRTPKTATGLSLGIGFKLR